MGDHPADAPAIVRFVRLAARLAVGEPTLACSLLASAIDDADPEADTVAATLEATCGGGDLRRRLAELARHVGAAHGEIVTGQVVDRFEHADLALRPVGRGGLNESEPLTVGALIGDLDVDQADLVVASGIPGVLADELKEVGVPGDDVSYGLGHLAGEPDPGGSRPTCTER